MKRIKVLMIRLLLQTISKGVLLHRHAIFIDVSIERKTVRVAIK